MKELTPLGADYAVRIITDICGHDREGHSILVGHIKSGRWTLTGDKAEDASFGRELLGNYEPLHED